jgi:hypothetical protein
MDTTDQIRVCHQRQWPQEYGRAFIPEPTSDELAPVRPHTFEGLILTPVLTTWCPTCGCDHGPAPVATDYGMVTA